MSVNEIFKTLAGCAGGKLIYSHIDETLSLLNKLESKGSLPKALRTALKPEFPKSVKLSKVRYVSNANGFSAINWFGSKASAITIGNRIYFKHSVNWSDKADCRRLMHELVHVRQYQTRGSSKSRFACEYGKGYAKANFNNSANRMEKKAKEFCTAHFADFWKRYKPPPPYPPPYPHAIWLLQD